MAVIFGCGASARREPLRKRFHFEIHGFPPGWLSSYARSPPLGNGFPPFRRLDVVSTHRRLLVAAADDPVIPASTIAPFLRTHRGAGEPLEVVWVPRAGHLGFARDLDLGFGEGSGMLRQVLHWLETRR